MTEHSFGNAPISTTELDQVAARLQAIKPAFDQAAAELANLPQGDGRVAPERMFDATMATLARVRGWAADVEARPAA